MRAVPPSERVVDATGVLAGFSGFLSLVCLVALGNLGLTWTVPAYARLTGADALPPGAVAANLWFTLTLLFVSVAAFAVFGLMNAGGEAAARR